MFSWNVRYRSLRQTAQTAQADLVESFLMRCGAKRDASLAMVEELQMAAGLCHGDVAMGNVDLGTCLELYG